MISSMANCGLMCSSRKTFLMPLKAPRSAESGVVTITAPRVPPRTIMAAVTWVISETLPPSITRPPTIPARAMTIPPMVAKSGFVDRSFVLPSLPLSAILCFLAVRHVDLWNRCYRTHQLFSKDRLTKCDHFFDDLLGGFQDDIFLARAEGDDGI